MSLTNRCDICTLSVGAVVERVRRVDFTSGEGRGRERHPTGRDELGSGTTATRLRWRLQALSAYMSI